MGMYTGLRFKGYVKAKYRRDFEDIALYGEWSESKVKKFRNFGESHSRAGFIPCGALSYMPDSWETHPYHLDSKATDGFDTTYNRNTGYWTFQCSLKNYEGELEDFLELAPEFIESVEWCEYFYEGWDYSRKYELINGEMKCVDSKFIRYHNYTEE